MTIQNARGKILLTKERAVEHTSHTKRTPELALGGFQFLGAQNKLINRKLQEQVAHFS